MKIVILDAYTANPGDLSWEEIEKLGNVEIYKRTQEDEILSRSKDADAILTNKVVISKEIMDNLPNLKYVGVLATGTNVVDLEAAAKKNIVVTNIPAYSTPFVAQHTFALLLDLFNKVSEHSESARAGYWAKCMDFSYTFGTLYELNTKRMGIIGLGSIGKKVADIAKAFGMEVVALESNNPNADQSVKRLNHQDFFSSCDVISLHCPLTEGTKEIINANSLNLMKKSAIILNTGRGPLINEADLAKALNEGRIGGAGLDVLTTEPPAEDNPLITAQNCVITPHIAWAAKECRERLIDIASNNLSAFMSKSVINQVN